jgi:hypothetical protein
MSKKTKTSRNQKFYRMKGCSKTRKNYLGGSTLAYTGNKINSQPNPFLAYTGVGGSSCGLSNTSNIPINTNAVNPAYPNTGPIPRGDIFLNPINPQRGGCGCGSSILTGGSRKKMKKGGCGQLCAMGFMVGGIRHRLGCKCGKCKKINKKTMRGGNVGIPYPNGLVGQPIQTGKVGGLPGENGIPGDRNYIPYNGYNTDIQTQIKNLGANPPFLKGGKRKQKGGTLSNFMTQDLINLGRQFQYGLGSAYNALAGYQSPVSPLPWKDQLINKPTLKSSAI